MKRILILILGLMFSNCNSQTKEYTKVISVEEFKQEIANNQVQIIDLRTKSEYENGHIEGAILIDYFSKYFEDKIKELIKEEPIYIYCRSGNRSNKASLILEKLGFTEIYDLKGGFNAWK